MGQFIGAVKLQMAEAGRNVGLSNLSSEKSISKPRRDKSKLKPDSKHVIRKRVPPRLPYREKDFYITNKSSIQVGLGLARLGPKSPCLSLFEVLLCHKRSDRSNLIFNSSSQKLDLSFERNLYIYMHNLFQSQISRCEKLLESETEVIIHGLGAAVARAINVALQLQEKYHGTVEVDVNTSTVTIIGKN